MTQSDAIGLASHLQNRAADPAVSAWVSASAGSGKTKVLIDRFVRLLLAGTPPQKILCLTYTQAAAAEMIERVTKRLSEWAVCDEEKLDTDLGALTQETGREARQKNIRRARTLFAAVLDCPGGLRIKTFHAFAQEVLARFPLEAGVVPHFTVLEEAMASEMREDALTALLRDDAALTIKAAWAKLVGLFDLKNLQKLIGELLYEQRKLTAALARYNGLDGLRTALYRQLQIDPSETAAAVIAAACADAALPLAALQQMGDALFAEGKDTAVWILQKWLALAPEQRTARFDDYKNVFLTDKETPRKKLLSAASLKTNLALGSLLAEEAERVQQVVRRCHQIERLDKTVVLLELGAGLLAEYAVRKARSAALDFDDVINRTAALLAQDGIAPWVLWKLDGGLDHLMIDEAQDTSPAQWAIIRAITGEFFAGEGARNKQRTLFVVGDEKQSIYSFQHADPSQFHAMRDYFQQQAAQAAQPFINVQLDVSFRSAPLVLEKIDEVFALHGTSKGVSVTPIQHRSSKPDLPARVTFWPALRPAGKLDKSKPWEAAEDYQCASAPVAQLAEQLAEQIKGWCAQGRQAGDIMILVRRRNALVTALVRALKLRGIPVSGVDRMVLANEISVKDMLAVLQFVLLPEDDLNLACVLRGPFVGMDEETLERLCVTRTSSLWQNLRADVSLSSATTWLQHLLGLADYGTVYDFLASILHSPCPTARSGKMAMVARLGRDALDPLDELLNRAQHFGTQQPDSLQLFLQQMLNDESQVKRALEQGAGEVRIMTVHAAKGLQAPIVILPDTCGAPRTRELAQLQWDALTGLPYYIGGGEATRDDFAAALHDEEQQAQLEEYRRLLYVALTRAESELHIYGYYGENKPQGFDSSWYRLIGQVFAPDAAEDAAPTQPLAVWEDQPVLPVAAPTTIITPVALPLPAWADEPAPAEKVIRPLSPSQLGAEDVAASPAHPVAQTGFVRGRLIHRLLQYLPVVPIEQRAESALRFLQRQSQLTDREEKTALAAEVLRIIEHPAYAPLFAPDSRAEVPLMGSVRQEDGSLVPMSGQLDRLALVGQEVLVVDYKTNRPPPAGVAGIPPSYRRQMAAYRALLQQIYPNKTVRCFLLWTYNATMMELAEESEEISRGVA